jgi:MYXO-CTERM domain-containing protein
MLRPLSAVVLASITLASPAFADIWTVGHGGTSQFYTVADALSDVRVRDGDTIRVSAGGYIGGIDLTDRALTLDPGSSAILGGAPGIIDVYGDLSVGAGSSVNFEIAGRRDGLVSGPAEFDQFIVTGNVNFSGALQVILRGGFTPVYGDSFALIQSAGSLTFTGTTVMPALAAGLSWNVSVVSGSSEFGPSGSSLIARVVPAPGAAALIGLAGLASHRRRRA